MRIAAIRYFVLAVLCVSCACSPDKNAERPALAQKGKKAPEITLPKLLNSPEKSISGWGDLSGKVVVLDFWATWCEPCLETMPHLDSLAEKFSGKDVVFISITDEASSKVESFLNSSPAKVWVAADASPAVFKSFRVYGRPHTVVVDKNSDVVFAGYPTSVNEEMIDSLLNGKPVPASFKGAGASADMPQECGDGRSFYFSFSQSSSTGTQSMSFVSGDRYILAKGVGLNEVLSTLAGTSARVYPSAEASKMISSAGLVDVSICVPSGEERKFSDFAVKALSASSGLELSFGKKKTEVYALKRLHINSGGMKPASRKTSSTFRETGNSIKAENMSVAPLASALERRLRVPVADETGIKGLCDYSFASDARDYKKVNEELIKQLGLKLEKASRQIDVLEISVK